MSDNINDGIKKMLYTGIGMAAISADAVGKAVNSLAAKGEEAVQRGKVMNEELRRKREAAKASVKDIAEALEKMTKEEIESIRGRLSNIEERIKEAGEKTVLSAESITARIEEMSKEEIDTIKAKLETIRMNWKDKGDTGAEF